MENLRTVLDWIRYATSEFNRQQIFYGHGTDNALDEAAALVLGMLKLPYQLDNAYFSANLTQSERIQLIDAIDRRVNERMPVPYLTKSSFYAGLDFYVDERVLIPRSPIAEYLANHGSDEPLRILDLCCGSGCLGIVAKYHNPAAEIVLADIDENALAVAQINVDRFHLNDDVEIVRSDLFANVGGQFDVIVCNPPYVESDEMNDIAPEFTHEPLHALISGADGLDLTRKILAQAADFLNENGILILEVGMTWQILEENFPECGFHWLEFENGGEGVCLITKDELEAWRLAEII